MTHKNFGGNWLEAPLTQLTLATTDAHWLFQKWSCRNRETLEGAILSYLEQYPLNDWDTWFEPIRQSHYGVFYTKMSRKRVASLPYQGDSDEPETGDIQNI